MNKILAILTEGLALWRTHLEKRKELYEVSLDKRKNKALNYAEEGFAITNELFNKLFNNIILMKSDEDDIKDMYKDFKRIQKKFNKYD